MPGPEPSVAGLPVAERPLAGPRPGLAAGEPPAHRTDRLDGAANGASLRRAIVLTLRRHGPATPDALAAVLGGSRSAVLQQLRALESAQLVVRRPVRHGVGRPRHVYDVTADAQELFPANYDGLAAGLLAGILEVGGEALLDAVFAARRRQLGARLQAHLAEQLRPGAGLDERVIELARFQDALGYVCEAGPGDDGILRIREHNCAILSVASRVPAACAAELGLFRDVLGVDVVRESHIAAGDRSCSYRVGRWADDRA